MSWIYQDTAGRQSVSLQPYSSCAYRCVVSFSQALPLRARNCAFSGDWLSHRFHQLARHRAHGAILAPAAAAALLLIMQGLCCSLCAS
jgi:hypothetical protein